MRSALSISAQAEITSGQRSIRNGLEYDKYFPKPDERDRIIIEDGEVQDTVGLMEKVVHKYLVDTARIAPVLKKSSLEETCRSIWQFIYHHVQYKLDKKGLEQLRRPARSWAERKTGVDCDCMSIFTSSILTNLKIPHSFRITKYSADHWQHVYVVVPDGRGKHIVIDAVVSRFNYEKPFSEKMDYPMSLNGINVAVLSGLGSDLENAVLAPGLTGLGATASASTKQELQKLYQHLVDTRNSIKKNPRMVSSIDDPEALVKMLDYAIHYWNTDKRDYALSILEKNEEQLNLRNGFSGLGDDVFDSDEFVLSGPGKKGFFKGVKEAVKDAGKGIKKAAKAIVRFNPLSIAGRGGFLIAMKLNLGKMASKLKWGYATKEEAAAKGISESDWNKSKDALAKVENLFADKLQGKRDALKNAILKGKAGNLNGLIESGFNGLGDPVTAATLAAATPIIIATVDILKKSGLIGPNEKIDAESIAKELANDPEAADALKDLEKDNNDGGDNSATTPSDDSGSKKGGIVGFIKANPVPTVIGGGLLAFGIYKLVAPKKKKVDNLAGYRAKKAKEKTHVHRIARDKSNHKKLPVKAVKLL
jgi:hypothetical protein